MIQEIDYLEYKTKAASGEYTASVMVSAPYVVYQSKEELLIATDERAYKVTDRYIGETFVYVGDYVEVDGVSLPKLLLEGLNEFKAKYLLTYPERAIITPITQEPEPEPESEIQEGPKACRIIDTTNYTNYALDMGGGIKYLDESSPYITLYITSNVGFGIHKNRIKDLENSPTGLIDIIEGVNVSLTDEGVKVAEGVIEFRSLKRIKRNMEIKEREING